MASEIDICNLALSHIGGGAIASLLNPTTKEQRQCALKYEFARDSVLEDHNWSFAKKQITLAVLSETYGEWTYAYQYPSDCIIAREIYDSTNKPGESEIEFDMITNADKNRQILLTNQENAELIYTSRVTDVNMFSSMFIEALSYRLAASMAIAIKGKMQLKDSTMNDYYRIIGVAQVNNANQRLKTPTTTSSFSEARL